MPARKNLLIEDCADLAHLLPLHPRHLDCAVQVARTAPPGWSGPWLGEHDLIVPGPDPSGLGGMEICQQLRHQRQRTRRSSC